MAVTTYASLSFWHFTPHFRICECCFCSLCSEELIKSHKSPGADGLPNEVLKLLAPSISYPLCLLFNLSFSSGTFPTAWKSAVVTPLFKGKGSKCCPANYRPISLLPTLSKVCERVFYDILYQHVSPYLSPCQSGFCRGDSTVYQLTRIVQELYQKRDDKQHVGICFFDLAKAFDTVWHRGLFGKLAHQYGITGSALTWLKSYLTDRTQCVKVAGVLSQELPVLSGVPQGSILGPLLFLLFVNDLPNVTAGVSLYADDTTLIRSSPKSNTLLVDLQSGINAVVEWMSSWKLKPNIAKTEAMFITPDHLSPALHFPDSSDLIKIVTHHKHLGVILDSSLSWAPHVEHICSRTSSVIGMIRPHSTFLSDKCKTLFYRSYVLPIFDYSDICWSGLSSSLANLLI